MMAWWSATVARDRILAALDLSCIRAPRAALTSDTDPTS
jgi:hypothetical protein